MAGFFTCDIKLTNNWILLVGNLALSHEKRLIKDLIDTYKEAGVTGRPVKNSSEPISLKYGLGLVQILRLDEKNQVLTIRAWNRLVTTAISSLTV